LNAPRHLSARTRALWTQTTTTGEPLRSTQWQVAEKLSLVVPSEAMKEAS